MREKLYLRLPWQAGVPQIFQLVSPDSVASLGLKEAKGGRQMHVVPVWVSLSGGDDQPALTLQFHLLVFIVLFLMSLAF